MLKNESMACLTGDLRCCARAVQHAVCGMCAISPHTTDCKLAKKNRHRGRHREVVEFVSFEGDREKAGLRLRQLVKIAVLAAKNHLEREQGLTALQMEQQRLMYHYTLQLAIGSGVCTYDQREQRLTCQCNNRRVVRRHQRRFRLQIRKRIFEWGSTESNDRRLLIDPLPREGRFPSGQVDHLAWSTQ